jgi:lipoprotein-anchoring transpeptidase ErfK/SrfK
VIRSFARLNPEGSRQVFLLQGAAKSGGGTWYRALLPMRPNGTYGWVSARDLRLAVTPYRLVVDHHTFRLTLWRGCRRVRTFPVGIGAGETPTPHGHFYLVALIKPPTANSVYGTYAYGLSAFSKVITTWKWGGVIGLHGTNEPSSIGHRVSHGCIRMRNKDIDYLVRILPLGTPITIQ